MNAENLIINNRCDRETVEALDKLLPKLESVSALALIKKTVDAVYRSTLMVSSKQEEVMWILDLVAHHEAHCLDALICTVHVITQKDLSLIHI